mgnify:CR=1 FL=1
METYDTKLECIDWRYSAAILGLLKYFRFTNEVYDKIDFNIGRDFIEYNQSDITNDRFLAFAEYEFREDMSHKIVENELYLDDFSDEKIKFINEKLSGPSTPTVMKKLFKVIKFDGTNKEYILSLIDENRENIIFETFKNKKNLYANFCNSNLLLKEKQELCRLIGYNVDVGRKSRSISYNFNEKSFVSTDMKEFDFIPFAFTNTYEAFFINNNANIEILEKVNSDLSMMVRDERSDNSEGNARTALFRGIITSAEFINYDVEVIVKNRNTNYYESLFIRKKAIDILRSLGEIKSISISYKVNDNYYINIQKEVIDCILNELYVDDIIELLLKSNKNYSYVINKLININQKIKGVWIMTSGMKGAYACAKKVVKNIESNKIKSYRQKLISAIVAKDYDRVNDILLQLSSYSGISFNFAYDLFEDFESNKDLAYTFINALEENKED